MAIQLTDAEIISLLSEPKALPSDYQSRLLLQAKTGHKEWEPETRRNDLSADIKEIGVTVRLVSAMNSHEIHGKPAALKTSLWHHAFTGEL